MRGQILSVLILALSCSQNELSQLPSKSSGLRLSKNKKNPEELAQSFQKTLELNDSEALMKLSLMGQEVKNWKIIANARNAQTLNRLKTELAEAEKTPRPERTEKEQARFFTLHSQISKLNSTSSDEYWEAQKTQLPDMRRQFTEKSYLQFVLAMSNAGIDPDRVKLDKIDTSRITKDYLESGLHGGTVILHYNAGGKMLEAGISYDCVEFLDEGWLIVEQPQVVRHAAIGPQPKPAIETTEPFAAPSGE